MRWKGREQSENVEDRRGMRAGPVVAGGGLLTLVIVVVVMLLGGDPRQFMQQVQQQQQQQGAGRGAAAGQPAEIDDEAKEFISVVLRDTEAVWTQLFEESGLQYRKPKLVIFSEQVRSGCGLASSGMGPFYCPADETVYIDPTFFAELEQRFGAKGDFAQAYCIAHEVGHHVQNLLGYTQIVEKARRELSEVEANEMSVRLELQADFYAGVWAHHAQARFQILEPGDIGEALGAAQAIGDDNIQQQTAGYVRPDSFTHGTSEQRESWFRKGIETGDPDQGNTFDKNVRL